MKQIPKYKLNNRTPHKNRKRIAKNLNLLSAQKLSIKLRLTLWYSFTIFSVLVIVLGFMILLSGNTFLGDSDTLLFSEVNHNLKLIYTDSNSIDYSNIRIYHNHIYSAVYDESGNLLEGAVPFNSEEDFMNGRFRTITIDNEEYNIYDTFISNTSSNGGIWLRSVISVDTLNIFMHKIWKTYLFATLIVILLGALGGYLVASLALKPVRDITDAANTISSGNELNKRIGLHKEGSHDELRQLSDAFDSMFERLEKSFDAQKQFASNASHELRTPITVIMAECDYANKFEMTSEEYKTTIEVISRQAKKMSNLVESLLTLTRMDLGTTKVNFEICDISEMLDIICTETSLISRKDVSIIKEITPDIYANVDVLLMSQLIQNLVNNAYRYNKENGWIKICLYTQNENKEAVISISDSGIGIKEENLNKIWDRFYQENTNASENKGVGLGLSLVKQIAEIHNADIYVESEIGTGTTFQVTLNTAEPENL